MNLLNCFKKMKKKEINLLNSNRIKKNLESFDDGLFSTKDEGRHPLARYASFDYCFNYFQGLKDKKELAHKNNIQNSCLHLGFYLASWGMLRNSFLLQKSIKFYEFLIKYISEKENDFWKIDVSNYTDTNLEKLINCGKDIKNKLGDKGVTDILVTKIMLGVFGNVPAFDTYFKMGSNLGTFNKHSLEEISSFYKNYSKIISDEATRIKTFEYPSGEAGSRSYTKAKIIDMIFFIEGYENDKSKKNENR